MDRIVVRGSGPLRGEVAVSGSKNASLALMAAALLAPGETLLGNVPFLSMFEEFEMKDVGVEESREMYGLLIIAGWMAIVGHRAFWKRRSPR